jgi:hypothetical protein
MFPGPLSIPMAAPAMAPTLMPAHAPAQPPNCLTLSAASGLKKPPLTTAVDDCQIPYRLYSHQHVFAD